MRGEDRFQGAMFSYVSLEDRVPREHPLRTIWAISDAALRRLSGRLGRLYARVGRPSIPPEKLLRALLLQVLYSVRSERLLMEELEYNLLFRWFVGLGMDEKVWDASTFSKNRERLLRGEVAEAFFAEVLGLAREQGLLSDEHFTVDGTLVEAWASQRSFRPREEAGGDGKEEKGGADFRGERRTNRTHVSRTDPDARLYRRGDGAEARLSYLGHVLVDAENQLVVGASLTRAEGSAEREAALEMLGRARYRRGARLGADRGYDVASFVREVRRLGLVPHVAQRRLGSALDRRTTRHRSYYKTQRMRRRVEAVFGWLKTVGLFRKTRHRGVARVGWMFTLTLAAYNLVRMRNLLAESA
ncbi:MAG: DDE transposase [Candidatus Binatia bacterium]|nr:MAG: DDE transposase [Candidatus Binatia bacterium]